MIAAMTNRMLTRAVAVAAIALLGACTPKTLATGCGPLPQVIFIPIAPTLLAPANGATGVPASTVTVQVQGSGFGQLRLTDPSGGVVNGTTFSPASTPGVSTATAPAPGTASVLAANTVYTVHVDYAIAQAECTPAGLSSVVQRYTFAIGSFTTQ
jgi:hypothetical protein